MSVLHWHHPEEKAWLSYTSGEGWSGWTDENLAEAKVQGDWRPWSTVVDHSEAPYVRWFVGASTNAAFNETDRYVLMGLDAEDALIAEPEKGDTIKVQRSTLLRDSVLAAQCMRFDLELAQGDRVAILLPNGPSAVVWIEAAKRSAVVFCAVAAGTASNSVASRITDTMSNWLITAENVLPTATPAAEIAAEKILNSKE